MNYQKKREEARQLGLKNKTIKKDKLTEEIKK